MHALHVLFSLFLYFEALLVLSATLNDLFCSCARGRREQQTTVFLEISKSRTPFQFQDSWRAQFCEIIEKLLQNARVSFSDHVLAVHESV